MKVILCPEGEGSGSSVLCAKTEPRVLQLEYLEMAHLGAFLFSGLSIIERRTELSHKAITQEDVAR